MACFVEGCLVAFEGVFWMVRGLSHPRGRLLAMPRYPVLDVVVKEPADLVSVARRFSGDVVMYSMCYGREVPLLRIDEIQAFANPLEYCASSDDDVACGLVKILTSTTGVDTIGVTGSRLYRWASSGKPGRGDIDLVVYGPRVDEFYHHLKENPLLEPYTGNASRRLIDQRGGWSLQGVLHHRESSKVLQGMWRGLDVYIRLVPLMPEEYSICRDTVYYLGERVLEGTVVDNSRGHVFPCTYELSVDGVPGGRLSLTSPRGRFCELLFPGDRIKAWGRLEIVRAGYVGEPRLQLTLADKSHGVALAG